MIVRIRPVLVLLVATLLSGALAQLALVVDGRRVGEVRTDVVAGHSYAPLDSLASGLGAAVAAPAGSTRVALTLGGHVIEIDVVEMPAEADRTGAIRLDGSPVGDLAAVVGDDAIWVPVTPLVRALGGHVSFVQDSSEVVVVTPRPTLSDAGMSGNRAEETVTLRLTAPTAWSRYENTALGLTELHLNRATLERARTLEGDVFRRVDLIPESDGVRIRVDAPGAAIEIVALADGEGSELRIRARAGEAETAREENEEGDVLVILDPESGSDGDATLTLARSVARLLRAEGIAVELTRTTGPGLGLAERADAGARADLFATLDAADLPAGEVRIWILGDAASDAIMSAAVRRNAATALAAGVEDEVRRRILVGLVPDLEVGRRYGQSISTTLFGLGGYRAGAVEEAPLAVLTGAAGRGVLLEFAPADLQDERLAEVLAAAIRSALGGSR